MPNEVAYEDLTLIQKRTIYLYYHFQGGRTPDMAAPTDEEVKDCEEAGLLYERGLGPTLYQLTDLGRRYGDRLREAWGPPGYRPCDLCAGDDAGCRRCEGTGAFPPDHGKAVPDWVILWDSEDRPG